FICFFFFQAEDGIRDFHVTGVQTCALPICTTSGAGKAVLTGTVTEWTGEMLRIRSSNGDIRELPADRIVDVQTARTQSHIDGLRSEERRVGKEGRRRG